MPNASSRQQAPLSVHPKDGRRLRTRNVSTAAITMEPTWYTPPTMAKYRYRVVCTAAYICASYCIFCGSSRRTLYTFMLVLEETQGSGITLTQLDSTTYHPGFAVLPASERTAILWKLRPYGE